MRDVGAGQPPDEVLRDRGPRDLSIVEDFSGFGTDITALKKRLRASGSPYP